MPEIEDISKFVWIDKDNKLHYTWDTNLIQSGFSSRSEAEKWFFDNLWDKVKQKLFDYYDDYNRKMIDKHYPLLKLQGFMQLSISLQMQLNDPNLTDDQKQAIQNKLNLTNAVNEWINQCTGLYYMYEQKFEQATTIDEINQYRQEIEQAYAQLEEQDPKVTYKQLAG